jgi:hypothetical protein
MMAAMSGMGRAIGAGVLALIALALLAAGGPPALEAYRAQRSTPSACGADLASLSAGSWVLLENCAVDKFSSSSFRGNAPGVSLVLAPLRGEEYELEEPSGFGLAFTPDSGVRFGPHEDEFLYTLRELTGVVLGPLDELDGTHVEAPEVDSGLAPGAVLIEARIPPPTQTALTLLAGGGVFLALAVWVALRGRGEESEATGVRWGLVAVLLIVALAGSVRWLIWFVDPVRQTDEAVARNERKPADRRAKRVRPAAAADPDATAEEIAGLASADGVERLRAADALMKKAVTPELVAAVNRALDAGPNDDLTAKLVCLKSRFPGPDAIAFLLQRLPPDRKALNWNLSPEIKCVFNALAARIDEDPLRIRDALVQGAFADNATVRSTVHTAYRKVDSPLPPIEILKALSSDDLFEYRHGLQAALALGAIRHNRAAVERAAYDARREVRGLVRYELTSNPHANAARIVAKRWLDGPSNSEGEMGLAFERERAQHDVSAALLEAFTDGTASERRREQAVRLMIELDEIGVLPELERLRPALAAGPVLDAVDAAIAHFEPRRKQVDRTRMRPLSP